MILSLVIFLAILFGLPDDKYAGIFKVKKRKAVSADNAYVEVITAYVKGRK